MVNTVELETLKSSSELRGHHASDRQKKPGFGDLVLKTKWECGWELLFSSWKGKKSSEVKRQHFSSRWERGIHDSRRKAAQAHRESRTFLLS